MSNKGLKWHEMDVGGGVKVITWRSVDKSKTMGRGGKQELPHGCVGGILIRERSISQAVGWEATECTIGQGLVRGYLRGISHRSFV